MIPQEAHPPLTGSPPVSGDSLWKESAALPHGQVPGQVPGGWLGAFIVQWGAGEDSNLQLRNESDEIKLLILLC